MKKSLIVWAALAGLSIMFFEEPVHAQRPNVVLMLVDNLGFGDLSSYNGGTRGGMRTPNIDRLASEGMRMTQFLVEPGCTPSRAGLMTGQYSIRNGMSLVIVPGVAGGLVPRRIGRAAWARLDGTRSHPQGASASRRIAVTP